MALTKEQIKNLNPGDPVIIHGTFSHIYSDGDICVKSAATCDSSVDYMDIKYAHPSTVSIVNPKYDTCRLFKKGDKVRAIEWNGRKPYAHLDDPYRDCPLKMVEGKIFIVRSEGLACTFVTTEDRLADYDIPTCHLELVTPVEELEPYYIEEKDIEFQVRMKYEDKDCLISVFRFKNIVEGYKQYYDMLPSMKQAGEAAAAECERLNKDYNNKQK